LGQLVSAGQQRRQTIRWVDISAPPGAGKSTLAYPVWGDKSITWDGLPPPRHWQPFCDELTNLLRLIDDHPSFGAVIRMLNRSVRKVATVERMSDQRTFFQVCLMQRITGIGWRLNDLRRDVNLIRRALWLMPIDAAAFLEAPDDVIISRNKQRLLNPVTMHEDRSYQVPLMRPAIEIAKSVMRERGIRTIEIDVTQPVEAARAELIVFADEIACNSSQDRSRGEVAVLSSPPPWWG
jgi:hypothetical protein